MAIALQQPSYFSYKLNFPDPFVIEMTRDIEIAENSLRFGGRVSENVAVPTNLEVSLRCNYAQWEIDNLNDSRQTIDREALLIACRYELELAIQAYLSINDKSTAKQRNMRTATVADAILTLGEEIPQGSTLPDIATNIMMELPKEFKNRRNSDTLSCHLHHLCRLNLPEPVQKFLNSGDVNVNIRDGTLATSLILVARDRLSIDIARVLLAAGANKDLFDDSRSTAKDYATRSRNADLLKLLSEY